MLPKSRPQIGAFYRLLAVRCAGAAFRPETTLRNEPFEALLDERERLSSRLQALRQPLVDSLYETIPTILDSKERRRVLKLKRNLFNGRPPGSVPPSVPPELALDIERYGTLLHRFSTLFEIHGPAVLRSSRERQRALLADHRFLSALSSASPDLGREIRRALDRPDREPAFAAKKKFSNTERALYSYAARFFSKANPFHLFASVQLPGEISTDPHEIGIEPKGLLALESRLLAGEVPARLVHLCLPPFARHGECCLFWNVGTNGLQVHAFPWSTELETLLSYFAARIDSPTPWSTSTEADWHGHLATLEPEPREALDTLLGRLVERKIACRYLLTDLADLAPLEKAATQAGKDLRNRVALAHRYHLAPVPDEESLQTAESELAIFRAATGARYFVNTFGREELEPFETVAATVASDLRDLKPVFTAAGHNFSQNDRVLRAYLRDYLRERPEGAPFLEVLTHFSGNREAIIRRYLGGSEESPSSEHRRRVSWGEQTAALEGSIDRTRLWELVDRRPRDGVENLSPGSLCFNGPYDFRTGIYTVGNIFDGHGHFASRYGLARSRDDRSRTDRFRAASPSTESTILDVEIAVPPVPNINFVVPGRPVATGFEPRYRHRYEQWIDPAAIELGLEISPDGEEAVVYRRSDTGRRLRFHYRGFMLSHVLPAEHQLLLLGHGDTYRNPFLRSEVRPGPGDLRHDTELLYGNVRLRRESWTLSYSLLREAPKDDDPVRHAVHFRDWLHQKLDRRTERWYYRTLNGEQGSYKPRYLDLRNPLSVHAFRRSLSRLPEKASLSFTKLDPSPESLLGGRMRELMIEV